jgi:ribulose-phosphate 3-epimerase
MDYELKVSPSILAADYGCIAEAAVKAESGGAEKLHMDYMDGHYVPNLSFGLDLIPALKKRVNISLVAHLMISNTEKMLESFIKMKPDYIVIQEDTVKNPGSVAESIRKAGIRPGFALNPDRPLKKLYDDLFKIDYLIILSVFPGFGGQTFMEETLEKMDEAHNFRVRNNLSFDLAVDGGVNMNTAKKIVKTGANELIAGTAIYGEKDVAGAIEQFLSLRDTV